MISRITWATRIWRFVDCFARNDHRGVTSYGANPLPRICWADLVNKNIFAEALGAWKRDNTSLKAALGPEQRYPLPKKSPEHHPQFSLPLIHQMSQEVVIFHFDSKTNGYRLVMKEAGSRTEKRRPRNTETADAQFQSTGTTRGSDHILSKIIRPEDGKVMRKSETWKVPSRSNLMHVCHRPFIMILDSH